MPSPPDPGVEPPDDHRLALGLMGLFVALAVVAISVHTLVPGGAPDRNANTPNVNTPKASANPPSPLLTRPQLLENQQAMPEMADFDAQNPPPNPVSGGGLGTPSPPSALGTGALGQ